MDNSIEVVDIPELDPPVLFTVGNAKAYVDPWEGNVLWVHCGVEAYDNVAMAAIDEQAELHGFPVLAEVESEHYTYGPNGECEALAVDLVYRRASSDALAC